MATTYEMIQEFHEVFGHPVNYRPSTDVSPRVLRLRINLILEELGEVIGAMGGDSENNRLSIVQSKVLGVSDILMTEVDDDAFNDLDLANLAKEITDLLVVVNGLAVVMGIDADRCMDYVHTSNMSKLGEDGRPIYRDDGKIMKGPDYKKPNMKRALRL